MSIPGIDHVTPATATTMALATMREIRKSVEQALVGRCVRVTSDHNGQPYGHSRRSWRGEVCRIKSIHVDLDHGVSLCLEGHEYECPIWANEVEFA